MPSKLPSPKESLPYWLDRPSLRDFILRPAFKISFVILSFTIVRLAAFVSLLPLYLYVAFVRSFLPYLIKNGRYLLTHKGREYLRSQGYASRKTRNDRAKLQLEGQYHFPDEFNERTSKISKVVNHVDSIWPANREYFDVNNLKACVVHEVPDKKTESSRKVVLLHGNPSWSFMYRNVIPRLLKEGHEVFALDWVGFGLSDKHLKKENIAFELHIKTLKRLFEHYDLHDAFVLAHDWGGAIALCTLPQLEESRVSGILLLNSFLPPRPVDITLNCYLLYLVWVVAQGLVAGYLPEDMVMRYMAPNTTARVSEGFSSPFQSVKSKVGVSRLAHLIPGMPDWIYHFFLSKSGVLVDGICPATTFSSLHEQVQLRKRDTEIRKYWRSGQANMKAFVLFGRIDPLLRDYHDVLIDTIKTKKGETKGVWLDGAGHYPAEERPDAIAAAFNKFVQGKI